MINLFNNFFKNQGIDKPKNNDNLELLCGLMIEAANTDGKIDKEEIEKIEKVLCETFKEDINEVRVQLDKAIKNYNNSKSLYYYTSRINKKYDDNWKLLLLETLWEIILTDGKVHDYESSLIRRLAGLLYISDVMAGNAKKRALNKISDQS